MKSSVAASLGLGATCVNGGVNYRVWAPDWSAVSVDRVGPPREALALTRDDDGYWSGLDTQGEPGDLYFFLNDSGNRLPDPASRHQPRGVHGPSQIVDPRAFSWQSADWQRPKWRGQTTYELHVGTFTTAGTFRAARERLGYLVELGVEAIELLPLADFPGERNWGYDGVDLFAPARCYGTPAELRSLVDAAHQNGLLVILDVVYNHIGPMGNYLPRYCADYFHHDRQTSWGSGYNLDGPRSQPVRDFLTTNVAYWLDEFRIDGLRLDATHAITDESRRHLLLEIAETAHARGAFVLAEDERQQDTLFRPSAENGYELDGAWADDFHHQLRVALTGTRESYFQAYLGRPEDMADLLRQGWTYRGQAFPFWQGRPRGSSSDHLPPECFVVCIENHDQVGNRALGERLEHLVSPAAFRAASTLLCLSPYAPLLFMGQEWAASSPFLFFTDHGGAFGKEVSVGRRREFAERALNEGIENIPDPESPSTFQRSKLIWSEQTSGMHGGVLTLYLTALRTRQEQLPPESRARGAWEVAQHGDNIFIRYRGGERDTLLIFALNPTALRPSLSGPLCRLEGDAQWRVVFHSNEARFGGTATRDDWCRGTGPQAAWLISTKSHAVG